MLVLQLHMVFYKLELFMVLLDPRHILQTRLIGLHALVRIHIPCHLIYFFGKIHS
jgi:hypothetical protein